jgi:predicted nucleic-acid-binding Zn-ribbon protein
VTDATIIDSRLVCPKCGNENLHQGQVDVFVRIKEDAPDHAIRINTDGAIHVGTAEDNPSSRRNGLAILFTCEQCHFSEERPFRLTIYQHKGETFIEWDL